MAQLPAPSVPPKAEPTEILAANSPQNPGIGPAGPSKSPIVTNPPLTITPNESAPPPKPDEGGLQGTKKSGRLGLPVLFKRRSSTTSPALLPKANDGPEQQEQKPSIEIKNEGELHHPPVTGVKDPVSKSKSPTQSTKIDIFQASNGLASIDIIAVHDLGETLKEAWTDEIPLAPRNILRNKNVFEPDRESSPGSHDRRPVGKTRREGPPPEITQSGARMGEPSTVFKEGGPTASKQDEVEDKGKAKETDPLKVQQPAASEAKTEASGKDSQGTPPTPDTPRKVKATRKEKPKSIEGSTRSSSELDNRDKPKLQVVNWLRDFITIDIPQSRVLAFSYAISTKKSKAGWMEDVESAARDLLHLVKARRKILVEKPAPIVFLGYGFGGIVIQKAIQLAVESNSKSKVREDIEKGASNKEMKQTNEQREKQNGKEDAIRTALEEEDKDIDPFPIHNIHQVLFLDTPFPESSDPQKKEPFPANTNVRMCSILRDIEVREKGSKLVEEVWSSFDNISKSFDINWLYSQARVKQSDVDMPQLVQDLSTDNYHKDINFTTVSTFKHRRLGRIPHSQDYIYRAIRSRIQSSLLFNAIAARDAPLVLHIVKCKPLDFIKNNEGHTPLHAAVLLDPPNDEIATVLVNAMPLNTVERDNKGQVPLHLALHTAWEGKPSENDLRRSYFSNVIGYLMRNMQRDDLDIQDHAEQSPWDQLCRPEFYSSNICILHGTECPSIWIRELRENLEPIRGPAIVQDHQGPIEYIPPKQDTPEYRASIAFDGTVSEFYHAPNKDTGIPEERINLKTPSVYTMIYDSKNGCARILQFSRLRNEASRDFRCRWIHVPANNEQWLSDLFLSIGVHDETMTYQRHDGLSVFNRYMSPQAKKYEFEPVHVPTVGFTTSDRNLPTVPEEPAEGPETKTHPSPTPSRFSWKGLPPINGMNSTKTIALFMPILAYESHCGREKMAKIIRHVTSDRADGVKRRPVKSDKDLALVEGYISKSDTGPLHCRRTLDQYSYYMLETTERRDKDQVVFRWATKQQGFPEAQAPVLMVDQLWLWVLPDGTVITSLPNTHKPSERYNIRKLLSEEIETNKGRHAIQGPDSLVGIVLKLCLNIMTRTGPSGVKLQECFQSSINTIAESEAIAMESLLDTVERLAEAEDPFLLTAEIDSFSKISVESRQLVEIIDIQDELNIIKSIITTQQTVLEQFQRLIRSHGKVTDSDNNMDIQDSQNAEKKETTGNAKQGGSTAFRSYRAVAESIRTVKDDLLRINEMSESAQRVHNELKQLLEFKQQQASGWESRYAMKLSEQGQRQNTTMLIFTIVTIIFLPMSFLASFFAIGIQEFPKDAESGEPNWPLRNVSRYLFGVGVAFSSVVLLGVLVYFIRLNRKNKKRLERSRQPPPPRRPAPKRRSRSKKRGGYDDDFYMYGLEPPPVPTISEGGTDTEGSDDDDDEGIADDDDKYAPFLDRYNWHTHIPGLRWLWEWRLYAVQRRRRRWRRHHRLQRSQEKWEWDYPLSRWRSRVTMKLEAAWRRFSSSLLKNKKKENEWWSDVVEGGVYYTEDGSECLSEDERTRKQAREMEHRERVEGRWERFAGIRRSVGSFFRVGRNRRDRDSVGESDSEEVGDTTERSGIPSFISASRRRRPVVDEEMAIEVVRT